MKTGRAQSLSFQTIYHSSAFEDLRAQIISDCPWSLGLMLINVTFSTCCCQIWFLWITQRPNTFYLSFSQSSPTPHYFAAIMPQPWVIVVGNNFEQLNETVDACVYELLWGWMVTFKNIITNLRMRHSFENSANHVISLDCLSRSRSTVPMLMSVKTT